MKNFKIITSVISVILILASLIACTGNDVGTDGTPVNNASFVNTDNTYKTDTDSTGEIGTEQGIGESTSGTTSGEDTAQSLPGMVSSIVNSSGSGEGNNSQIINSPSQTKNSDIYTVSSAKDTIKPGVTTSKSTTAPAITTASTTSGGPQPIKLQDQKMGSKFVLDSSKIPAANKPYYDAMIKALEEHKNEVDILNLVKSITPVVSGKDKDGKDIYDLPENIKKIIEETFEKYVSRYRPDLFYIGNGYSSSIGCSITMSGGVVTKAEFAVCKIIFTAMSGYGTTAQLKQKGDELKAKVKQIIDVVRNLKNDFEREVYIHDYLVKNVVYDKSKNYSSAYDALVGGRALCEGYSRAFQLLMLEAGMETYLITGYAGENHMWNIVKLNNNYYHVDVTHDDPVPDESITNGQEERIRHTNLNRTDAVMKKTHSWTSVPVSGMSCISVELNFYRIRGLMAANAKEYQDILTREKNNGKKYIEVLFSGSMISKDEMNNAVKGAGITYSIKHNYITTDSGYKKNVLRISQA